MTIIQLEFNKETAYDIMTKDNVYFVRFSEKHSRKEDGRKKEMPEMPYAMSFKSFKTTKIAELVEEIKSGKACVVQVER